MRRLTILVGVLAGVVIGFAAATAIIGTTAEDTIEVDIGVTWSPIDGANDPCYRRRSLDGNTPVATLNGFPQTISIRNAEDHIVSMTALREVEVEDDLCRATITAPLDGAGHTVWLDDRYLAGISPDGLPDHASIVLEDWD